MLQENPLINRFATRRSYVGGRPLDDESNLRVERGLICDVRFGTLNNQMTFFILVLLDNKSVAVWESNYQITVE